MKWPCVKKLPLFLNRNTLQTTTNMGRIYNNIVETVGRTPLVKLNRVTAGLDATIALKCEYF